MAHPSQQNPGEEYGQEYMNRKRQNAEHGQLSYEQKVKQELRKLPTGQELYNWICHHVGKRLGKQVLWQTQGQAQNGSQQLTLLDAQTRQVIHTVAVNRKEIAQVRATGESWIQQLMFAIQGGEAQNQSQMHEKFENDLSSRYGDMMEKLKGNNQ